MIIFYRSWLLTAILGFALLGGTNAFAQAAHDTSLLTDAERTHYRALLAKSNDSAERAKVKSEMNRLIQTRRLELRKKQQNPDATPTTNSGS
ncbi:hypothetical protein [Magnetovibrio sp.]|uniref:hypothetical protein n=1 Tax=Magnetovibrio sp. TaxID=2024836 RepID=UPI002F920631